MLKPIPPLDEAEILDAFAGVARVAAKHPTGVRPAEVPPERPAGEETWTIPRNARPRSSAER